MIDCCRVVGCTERVVVWEIYLNKINPNIVVNSTFGKYCLKHSQLKQEIYQDDWVITHTIITNEELMSELL